jgi:hypothetical protein
MPTDAERCAPQVQTDRAKEGEMTKTIALVFIVAVALGFFAGRITAPQAKVCFGVSPVVACAPTMREAREQFQAAIKELHAK